MLEKKRIVAYRGAVGFPQQPVPQLPLQQYFRMRTQFGPQALQHAARPAEAQAVAAKLTLDGQRVGREIVAVRQGWFEPCEQRFRPCPVRLVPADLDKRALAQLVGDKGGAVGGDAKKSTLSL